MKSINIYYFLLLLFALKFDLHSIYCKIRDIFQTFLTFINNVYQSSHFNLICSFRPEHRNLLNKKKLLDYMRSKF